MKKKKNIDAVIFDMGGTLMDYDPVPADRMRKIRLELIGDFMNKKGYKIDAKRIDECLMAPYYEVDCVRADRTLKEVNLGKSVKRGLKKLGVIEDYSLWIIRMLHLSLKKNLIVYEDTAETLSKLSEKYALGLISNTTIPGVFFAEDLDELGFSKHFKHMLFTADLGLRKPHRSVFDRMLSLLGVRAERSIYVGDSFRNDIFGPSQIGMKTAWINPCDLPAPDKYDEVEPDLVVKSVGGLLEYLY